MKVITVVLTLFIMMTAGASFAMENTTLLYRESTEQDHEDIPYIFKAEGDRIRIEADFKDEYQSIVTDTSMNTKELEISFPEKSDVISIYREDDVIVINRGKARCDCRPIEESDIHSQCDRR